MKGMDATHDRIQLFQPAAADIFSPKRGLIGFVTVKSCLILFESFKSQQLMLENGY